ncbi:MULTISPECIES: hypothetical protein [unclassified Moraxella]|uniref:hypothetical protein n=1 Tax=unclassified Moraxella TaxID=2685852 RepID=UPI003AF6530D
MTTWLQYSDFVIKTAGVDSFHPNKIVPKPLVNASLASMTSSDIGLNTGLSMLAFIIEQI